MINLAKGRDSLSLDRHVVINDACGEFHALHCLAPRTGCSTVLTIRRKPWNNPRSGMEAVRTKRVTEIHLPCQGTSLNRERSDVE